MDGQAGAIEKISDSEVTPLMIQAGMDAYAKWSEGRESCRTLANMVLGIYAAAEAERRRAHSESV